MLFNGYLIATGGNGSYPGGPGTVYVQSDVGTDRWRELWIDNLNRGNENTCTYETSIDNIQLDNIHLNNRACAILTKVIKTIICNFDTFPLISLSDIVSIKKTNSEIIGQEHISRYHKKIMSVLKVSTNIIISIAAPPTTLTVISIAAPPITLTVISIAAPPITLTVISIAAPPITLTAIPVIMSTFKTALYYIDNFCVVYILFCIK
jgi:hypothetical protein